MSRYVVAVLLVTVMKFVGASPAMRVTIDCPTDDTTLFSLNPKPKSSSKSGQDVSSLCDLINSAIPKAVEDGHLRLVEERSSDQEVFENTFAPIAVPPPRGFIPKLPVFKSPRINIPKINIPALVAQNRANLAPKIGPSMVFHRFREQLEEESSAERLEKFKKGVKKLLHVVKVLGKVDEYISDRTRIVVEKLSKTLAE